MSHNPSPALPRKWLLNILAFSALAILVALGAWQLRRMAWKTRLIADIQQALTSPPETYAAPQSAGQLEGRQFRRVRVSADFLNGKQVLVYSATPSAFQALTQDGYGYSLIKPAAVGNRIVFIDLGFVPASVAFQSLDAKPATTIDGVIREPEPSGTFSPPPDLAKRVFYTADIPAMARALDLPPDRSVVTEYIEATPIPGAQGWPRPRDPQMLADGIPNRHLEYALTWFGLAATLVGVFIAYSLDGWRRGRRASV